MIDKKREREGEGEGGKWSARSSTSDRKNTGEGSATRGATGGEKHKKHNLSGHKPKAPRQADWVRLKKGNIAG